MNYGTPHKTINGPEVECEGSTCSKHTGKLCLKLQAHRNSKKEDGLYFVCRKVSLYLEYNMDTIDNNDDEQVITKSAANGTDLTKSYLWGRYEFYYSYIFL